MAGRSVSGKSCWEKRATALSFTQGDREELSRFALKRDRSVRLNIRSLSGFRELWHHKRTGGRGKGGAGLGFCRLSLSLYIPQAWLGAGGGGQSSFLVLSSVGKRHPERELCGSQVEAGQWSRGSTECRRQREVSPLPFGSPVNEATSVSPADC